MRDGQDQQTIAVRAGVDSDDQFGAVMPPLHLTSNFSFRALGDKRQHDYSRTSNPTRDALGEALASLEEGAGAVVTSSGMAAIALTLELLPLGARVIAPFDCYGGTFRLLSERARKGHLSVEFVDLTCPEALDQAVSKGCDLLWIESPTNPLLRIVDIQAAAERARDRGGLVAVDNTFLSPALQQPLRLGADLAVHSTTKYLNGHSDVVGGAVIARSPEHLETLQYWGNALGVTGAPFDSFLTLRGLRTLHARLKLHEENAALIAQALSEHPAVKIVNYPGLPEHPQHKLARRQQSGFGGMLSFELDGGEHEVRRFVEHLELFSLAESLGGVESLVCHPATMTHLPLSEEDRMKAGISDGLLRLSIGIEHGEDLKADLLAALGAATRLQQVRAG